MALTLVSGPAIEPVSLKEAKDHCRVRFADDDALITALIRSAREWVETATHRPLITQTWDWKRDAFPRGELVLPLPPVSSITSVTYLDPSGATQTWSSSLYLTDLPAGPRPEPARITPIFAGIYPVTQSVMNAVTVRFVAGYGTVAESVPEGLRSAMKLMIAHWYSNRTPFLVMQGATMADVPLTVDALVWPFKSF